MWKLLKTTSLIPKKIVMWMIGLYQRTLSPDHGWIRFMFPYGVCRYTPTCSQYTHQAIKRYGLIRGWLMGSWRVMRCNPWSKGGHDPVR